MTHLFVVFTFEFEYLKSQHIAGVKTFKRRPVVLLQIVLHSDHRIVCVTHLSSIGVSETIHTSTVCRFGSEYYLPTVRQPGSSEFDDNKVITSIVWVRQTLYDPCDDSRRKTIKSIELYLSTVKRIIRDLAGDALYTYLSAKRSCPTKGLVARSVTMYAETGCPPYGCWRQPVFATNSPGLLFSLSG